MHIAADAAEARRLADVVMTLLADDDASAVATVRREPALWQWRDASNGHSLLHVAARRGNVALARALLDAARDAPASALVDAANKAGHTALHDAAAKGQLELVTLLVERGADVALLSGGGQSALALARDAGHASVADRLEFAALSSAVR